MKNGLKKLALGLLVVTTVASLAGCGKKKAAVQSGPSFITTRDKFKWSPTKYKGKTVKIWSWWDMPLGDAEKAFQDATGAKVETTNIPWGDEFNQKTISAVTAGNGPDIVWVEGWANPTWINKKILAPIGDYIDLKSPEFKGLMPKKVQDYWTFGGHLYAWGENGPNMNRLYYRKDLFKNNGLEDPVELFKKGQWTWDKFFEVGQELTQDTNGDGTTDQWGYDAWPVEQWWWTNGVDVIKMVDGKPTFGLDDPKAIEALQAIRDMDGKYKIKSPWDPNKDPQQKFIAGVTAMDYWGFWDHENFQKQLGDKLGFAPFPVGPSFKGKMADTIAGAMIAITTCAEDKKFIGDYISYVWLPATAEDAKTGKEATKKKELALFGGQEGYDLAYEMAKNAWPNNYGGYGDLGKVLDKIMWNSGDMSPAQAVAANKDAAQAQIDTVWEQK